MAPYPESKNRYNGEVIPEKRYPELDAIRGLAVISMILFHLCFDLAFFYEWNIPIREGLFSLWSRGTAMTFLMVIGVCFVISWQRTLRYEKYLRRGLIFLFAGMLISLITYLIAPGAYVKFGIIHMIGVSALLQPLFVRLKGWNIVLGTVVSIGGIKISEIVTENPFLFPFGITYPGFFSLDYYPLLPWFGFVLTGMGLGFLFYTPRNKFLERMGTLRFPNWLLWSGKRAFPLYFLHQLVLIMILSAIFGAPFHL